MDLQITSMEDLEKEAVEIDSFLQITMSEDGNEAIMRGNVLAVYISRSGKMLADAKYHLNKQLGGEVIAMLSNVAKKTPFATAKTVNALTDSLCRDERYLMDWINRINATATHQLEWCRTVVSNAKTDKILSRGMNQ